MFEISLLNSNVLFFILNEERKDYLEIINYLPNDVVVDDINYINQARSIDVSNVIFHTPNQTSKSRIVKILTEHLK